MLFQNTFAGGEKTVAMHDEKDGGTVTERDCVQQYAFEKRNQGLTRSRLIKDPRKMAMRKMKIFLKSNANKYTNQIPLRQMLIHLTDSVKFKNPDQRSRFGHSTKIDCSNI